MANLNRLGKRKLEDVRWTVAYMGWCKTCGTIRDFQQGFFPYWGQDVKQCQTCKVVIPVGGED